MPSIAALTVCVMDEFPQKNVSGPGGNSLNFALGCRKFPWEQVSMIGAVGDDPAGAEIQKLLAKKGINTERLYIREGATANNKIYITEAGERYAYPEDWHGGVYENFRLSEEDWDFVFQHDWIASTFYDPNLPELLRRIEGCDNFLSIDCLDSPPVQTLGTFLDKLDLAFISCEVPEIGQYRRLAGETPIILMLGAKGSLAWADGREYRQPALPVDKVIDTTGCGDAFQAAFCSTWFQTRDVEQSLHAGAEAGREILSVVGGCG